MDRRLLIKAGLGLGTLAGAGAVARYAVLPPPHSAELASVDELAVTLVESMSDEARGLLGRVATRRTVGLLRDALVAHIKAHGFTGTRSAARSTA